MPVGTISEVSRIQWNLINFSHLDFSSNIESPAFTSMDISWILKILHEPYTDSFRINLYRTDLNADFIPKKLVYEYPKKGRMSKNGVAILGIRRFDSTLDESKGFPFSCHSNAGYQFSFPFILSKSQLLPSDTLTVTCRFACGTPTAEKVQPNPSTENQQMKLVELEDLSSDFKDLLSSERKCDATVNVQGKEFRVHRAVLSARSSVFCAMYEHETSEDKTGYLTIPDCDPESFGDFLNYIYTGKLEEISFRAAYHLYATAEKYDVQKLKSFCTEHLKKNLAVENACEVFVLADRYGDDVLTSSAQEFFNKNFLKMFQTSEWKAMLRNSVRLADKILSDLAPSSEKDT